MTGRELTIRETSLIRVALQDQINDPVLTSLKDERQALYDLLAGSYLSVRPAPSLDR